MLAANVLLLFNMSKYTLDHHSVRVHTVDGALELLAAHLALQVANAELLVELHGNRLLVVAEEAGKGRGKRVGLSLSVVSNARIYVYS